MINMQKKKYGMVLLVGVMVLMLCGFALAQSYLKMCLSDGESIPSQSNAYYTCDLSSGNGYCEVCARADSLDPRGVNPFYCGEQSCNFLDGASVDADAPEVGINFPVEGEVYTSRRIDVEISMSENSRLEKYDASRNRWSKMCSSYCFDYSRSLSFSEGEQELTVRATDSSGNSNEASVSFFVDSKDPRVSRTYPRRGFADGSFEVQFKEDNPVELVLHYGNSAKGYRSSELNIESDCYIERGKYYCDTEVNLNYYHGGEIEYWFVLEDIAGNVDESKVVEVAVDTVDPVFESSYDFDGRYVYFEFEVDEENFDEISYSYIDERGRERERRLCSRLREGFCEKRVSFKEGSYELDILVLDEAGNWDGETIEFEIRY